jgi:plasmid stabilization system protein ParE
MPKPIELHPAAVREAAQAFRWYASRSARAAERFVLALDRAIDQVQERPESFPLHQAGTKRCLLARYPYLVVFRELTDRIQVIAIAHGHRRPGYWRRRK